MLHGSFFREKCRADEEHNRSRRLLQTECLVNGRVPSETAGNAYRVQKSGTSLSPETGEVSSLGKVQWPRNLQLNFITLYLVTFCSARNPTLRTLQLPLPINGNYWISLGDFIGYTRNYYSFSCVGSCFILWAKYICKYLHRYIILKYKQFAWIFDVFCGTFSARDVDVINVATKRTETLKAVVSTHE